MKNFSIILLVSIFLGFFAYENFKQTKYNVLEVVSPTEIILDLNGNGIKDDDETVFLNNIQSFSAKPSEEQSQSAKKIKISEEDAFGLGFLAKNFANEHLSEKQVKLEYSKSNAPVIYVDNQNYQTILLSSGLAFAKDSNDYSGIKKNIEKVHKLNLRTFNNKSHKYHKLNCKYGLKAHNSQILPSLQLPKDAKPCKFCLVKHQEQKHNKKKKIREEFVPNIKQPPTAFSTSSIKIFLTDLTKVLKPSYSCNTAFCRALLQEINSAQSSIDFAIYGYTKVPELQKALENAQNRGVKIRFVYDTDGNNNNKIYTDNRFLTEVFKNNKSDVSPAIMHDKFFIFDNNTVLTGSANISNTDLSGFNSNAIIIIKSTQIAQIYTNEFEQMFNNKFHKAKSKIGGNENLSIDCADFSVYFSPEDKIISTKIIPLIDNSKKYIYMPVFLITHKGLVTSLINASHRGVDVKVVLDATNASGSSSKHKILRDNGILVKTEIFAGKLHSKSIIIDDEYTIIGSMNFSKAGENVNDENLIIIKNREIALFYKTFFQYLWQRIPEKWLHKNARSESPDSIGSCHDGVDNDFDDKIDGKDDSCTPFRKRLGH